MAENVGTIYFTVEAETSKLIYGTQAADSSLDRLERQFGKTDKAAGEANFTMTKTAAAVRGLGRDADGATSSLSGLGRVLGGLLTLQGVNNLIQMAEGYNTMAERVRMATSSQVEYELVQQRLLATANKTYRALSEAQEIYIQTADGLRSMGYSTSDALDITDSLSYSFVKNATAADRAQSALRAYDLALNKGKVDAMGWLTVVGAIPSVVADIAVATGKTEAEIRRMGASGEITARMLNEGLRQSLDSNKKAADGMATTVADAFTAMRNNLAAYVGEANQASGATSVMSAAIVGLGENIDAIVKTLMTVGAGALALYIARTGAAALSSAQAMLAARAEAAENLRLAQARTVATQAALAHAQANAGLTGTFAALTTAENANRAATTALVAAQRAAASTGATLLGILGGPVGIIGLVASAAAGMYLFSDSANTAKIDLAGMGDTLEDVKKKIAELSESERKLAEQSAQLDLDAAVRKLGAAYDDLARGSLADGTRAVAKWRAENSEAIADIIDSAKRGEMSYRDLDSSLLEMVESYAKAHGRSREWVSQMTEQIAATKKTAVEAENARQKLDLVAEANRQVAATARDAAAGTRELGSAMNDAQTDDYLKRLQERRQAIEDDGSATKAAERYISSLKDVSEERIQQIRQEATEIDRLNAAKRAKTAATKTETEAERKAKQAADEARRAHESNAQAIDRMAQALRFAALSGEELAKAQAAASLNSAATPEQVATLEALAVALHRVQKAEEARKKVGGTTQEVEQYVFGDVQPLSGGAFDNQTERYDAEAKAEQKRYEEQLKRLEEAKNAEIQQRQAYATMIEELQAAHLSRMTDLELEREQAKTAGDAQKLESDIALEQQKYEDELTRLQDHLEKKYQLQVDYGELERRLDEENAKRKAQIDKAKTSAMLTAYGSAFGSIADMIKESQGEQSGAYKAMFAASKAFAIADAGIKLNMAIMQALADPTALTPMQKFANYAAVATAGAGLLSAISGASFGGGRQYGGPVGPGRGYRINENGAPEILNMANGQQFLLPNSRGQVVSNKDATASDGSHGQPQVIVNLIENRERAGQIEQYSFDQNQVIDAFVADIGTGGRASQALEVNYGLKRRGR